MVRDIADRLGLPAALKLVSKLGGTTIPVPMRATVRGEARFMSLADTIGAELAEALCSEYAGTDLYVPLCRDALKDARDAALCGDRDLLAASGFSERELVATLALQYKMSDRQVWRILKRPPPNSAQRFSQCGTMQARVF